MSGFGGKAFSILAVGAIGWYTGVKFWRPLIIEQLQKDNNLDETVVPPEYVDDAPKSWEELKSLWKTTIHPEEHPLDGNKVEQLGQLPSAESAQSSTQSPTQSNK